MAANIIIYTDGAARGNPGPSASGFVVYVNGRAAKRLARYNGVATNNFAEYTAVIEALRWCAGNVGGREAMDAELYSDSELVIRQLNGVYKVKEGRMKELNAEARRLAKEFRHVKFGNVPREERHIRAVDKHLNDLLDAIEKTKI